MTPDAVCRPEFLVWAELRRATDKREPAEQAALFDITALSH
jgi:hypothetical protein